MFPVASNLPVAMYYWIFKKHFLEKTINDRTPSIGYRNAIGENWGVWKLPENIEGRAHAVYIKSAGNQINSIAWQ